LYDQAKGKLVNDQELDAQAIVQRQMEAYNRRDADAFCSYFAPDAVTRLYENDELLAAGIDDLRALYTRRFAENPNLQMTVQARMVLDNVVVDRELIRGFDGGITIEAIAIHEVRNGKIVRASFIRRTV
jgi:hypothetical protein